MADRGIRSLIYLQNTASTARLLNLLSTWRRHKDKPEYSAQPFFQNKRLNRAMLLKHRLRRDDFDVFDNPLLTATKIVFPVDPTDLKAGGKFAFIGQRNFPQLLEDVVGENEKDSPDLKLLQLLDRLPSFDPYLLREELKRHGFEAATCYLELSEADLKKIFNFAQCEIEPLVRMSLGGKAGVAAQTSKLVEKILANKLDVEMQALRQVLRLSESEFPEGVFCWKGFLYYKWVYQAVAEATPNVINTITRTTPLGKQDADMRERLSAVRTVVASRFVASAGMIETSLGIYDHAYAQLTQNCNPTSFREFLLTAPAQFAEIGERLGVLQHITSFCQYRFPANQRVTIAIEELLDIFNDFEAALYVPEPAKQVSAVA